VWQDGFGMDGFRSGCVQGAAHEVPFYDLNRVCGRTVAARVR
jgi:hypothetical protein